jgi:hypothetical protein
VCCACQRARIGLAYISPSWCSTCRVDGLASRRERQETRHVEGTRSCTEAHGRDRGTYPGGHVCMEHVVYSRCGGHVMSMGRFPDVVPRVGSFVFWCCMLRVSMIANALPHLVVGGQRRPLVPDESDERGHCRASNGLRYVHHSHSASPTPFSLSKPNPDAARGTTTDTQARRERRRKQAQPATHAKQRAAHPKSRHGTFKGETVHFLIFLRILS